MDHKKSLDPYKQIIVALLSDVLTSHNEVYTPRSIRLTIQKVEKRLDREGLGFLTKTLPRLGKAFDRALTGEVQFDCSKMPFKRLPGTQLPKLFGELFKLIFSHDGWVLPRPCVRSIKSIRLVLYLFYKLELPYAPRQEQEVLQKFVKTDEALLTWNSLFEKVIEATDCNPRGWNRIFPISTRRVIRRARRLLFEVFKTFDVKDIHPRHGPGAVSTKERLEGKYTWSSISARILQTYPLDEYYYSSLGHVCDSAEEIQSLPIREESARVILVPKDSRGPRLISCEPLTFQWIQQGLGRAIVQHVERHPLTRYQVHFTDQRPNQLGALLGSTTGKYSTLDLNEASDRVSTGLVRLLFPEPLCSALLNCRSESTVLPGGQELKLNKFAPMGSALCFPVLAMTCWAILNAGLPDARRSLQSLKKDEEPFLVYGDDVIVESAKAQYAIQLLESFGLLINRDKSCCSGFFRESCGEDAYKGEPVTPVRIRTVWTHHPSPEAYASYIAYANHLYLLKCYNAYDVIVEALTRTYGEIPEQSMNLSCPSLVEVPEVYRPKRRRVNKSLQKLEYRVLDVLSRKVHRPISGWKMLLRFFAESTTDSLAGLTNETHLSLPRRCGVSNKLSTIVDRLPFSVSTYTDRKASYLAKRWR